jgi:hypothetical protein
MEVKDLEFDSHKNVLLAMSDLGNSVTPRPQIENNCLT